MKIKFLFFGFIALLFFSCNSEETINQNLDAKTILNVSYGNNVQQKFDLYLPANRTTNTKTLILVHGGGWIEGDKADMNYAVDIVKQYLPEYAIANINYRLATTGNPAFPMQIDDIESVITKLKTEDYQISDDFGFIGVSAGAHLSMLYSYAYNSDIKVVCSIVGPTNFTDVNYTSNPFMVAMFQSATGLVYSENIGFYQQISPFHRATANSQPTILLYGNADPLIPTTQGQDMHAKLNELGVYNEFYLYNGGHGDWAINDQIDAYNRMVDFIKNKF
ncbi:MAG: alpha/beta hydrolase [Flavobacterium sp.]|uniref:alpha/beta hydrolase n=1 Tax=Flavobacterium sp. TaxID=239 RepID=UPI0022C6F779|nr:alpha/beta hydrolase [Flavobacterium sp.]MCZ8197012.1 alpha/beta hydrolase [Flavobacterium sp.]